MKKTMLAIALVAGLTSFIESAKASIIYNNWTSFSVIGSQIPSPYMPLNGITNTFSVQQRIGFNNTFDPLFGSSPDSGQLCGFNYSGGGVVGYTVLANIGDTIDASTAGWSSYTTVTNNGVHYFGISFNNNGVTNYGFLVANTSGYGTHSSDISFSLAAYSYDNTGAAITVVPEPSTYALFGIGAIGMLMVFRRKKAA